MIMLTSRNLYYLSTWQEAYSIWLLGFATGQPCVLEQRPRARAKNIYSKSVALCTKLIDDLCAPNSL